MDRITNPVLTDHSVLECQRNDEMLRFFDQYSFDAPEFRYEYDVRKLFRFYAKAHCEVVLRNMQFRIPETGLLCDGADVQSRSGNSRGL